MSALPEELAPLRRRVAAPRRFSVGGQQLTSGRLGTARVVLAVMGDGAVRARQGLTALLDHVPVDRLLVLGVAGALSPSLQAGAVLAAQEVRDLQGRIAPAPDPRWLAMALRQPGIAAGRLVTADAIVTKPSDKAALWQALPQDLPAAVDMESVAAARVAAQRGVPYLVLRAISDTALEELPHFLPRCQRSDGSTNRARVVGFALRYPRSLPVLFKMHRRMRQCADRLARAVVRLVE